MDERSDKDYKALAFIPMLTSLGLYVGYEMVFTIVGTENSFGKISCYVAVMAAIAIAMIFYDRNIPTSREIDIHHKGVGSSGIMFLGTIALMAGGFSSAAAAMGGKESIVNMGLTLTPSHFLIPGVFTVTRFISTCIGTSMGAQVAMTPVAVAVAQGAGPNAVMAGTAVIAGAYFGDNPSTISGTATCATKGVGAETKDKLKMNFPIALSAAVITIALYLVLGANGSGPADIKELYYSMPGVLPCLTVLVTATADLNVPLVLLIGILMSGVIGIVMGTVTSSEWTMAIGAGIEEMLFLVVFPMLVSGLIELIKHHGGTAWLVRTMTEKIRNRKGYEYLIPLASMAISGTTLNNPIAIIITASVAKELGSKYRIALKRLASLSDIFPCGILMLVSYDSNVPLVQQHGGVTYLEIMRFAFYPTLLVLSTYITIQFGLLRTKEGRESKL